MSLIYLAENYSQRKINTPQYRIHFFIFLSKIKQIYPTFYKKIKV